MRDRPGIGQEWAVIAHHDDTIERIAHPAPWAAVQQQHRRIARQLSRRVVGSRGHRQANAKLAALDRRAVNLRREFIHTLTTSLARRYAPTSSKTSTSPRWAGGWAGERSGAACTQAGLGRVRPTLAYKCAWGGGELVVADRWFASSKFHWYGRVTVAEVPTLVEQHLVGGEPVELLRIGPEDFCS